MPMCQYRSYRSRSGLVSVDVDFVALDMPSWHVTRDGFESSFQINFSSVNELKVLILGFSLSILL